MGTSLIRNRRPPSDQRKKSTQLQRLPTARDEGHGFMRGRRVGLIKRYAHLQGCSAASLGLTLTALPHSRSSTGVPRSKETAHPALNNP